MLRFHRATLFPAAWLERFASKRPLETRSRPTAGGRHRITLNGCSHIEELPLYPEQRQCRRPTTEQVLRLFSLAERHALRREGHTVQVFHPELTDLQRQVLTLLGVPQGAFRPPA